VTICPDHDSDDAAPASANPVAAQAHAQAAAEPAYLRSLIELRRSLGRKLDDTLREGDPKTGATGPDDVGALYPFSVRLGALLELNVALTAERDLRRMLNLFCRSAQDILNCKYVALALLDRDRKRLRSITTRGLDAEVRKRFEAIDPWSGVFGHVMGSDKLIRFEDAEARAGLPEFHPPVRSLLVLPMPVYSAAHASGWLYFADKLGGSGFDLEDERFAVAVSAQFALAFGNLRLYEEVEQHADWLEAEVAERERTAQALADSELRFRQIAENVDAVFLLVEPDSSRVHYVSPAYERIWGRSCASLYANPRSWIDAVELEDGRSALDAIQARAASGTSFLFDGRVALPDGETHWIRLRGSPVYDTDGRLFRIAAAASDITHSRRAEDARRESDRRFNDMLDNIELIAVMIDRDGRLIYCNDHFLALFGWLRHEVLGRDWFERFVPPDARDRRDVLTAILSGSHQARHHESEILSRSGERRLVRWNNSLLHAASGEVAGVASIGEDITEQRRAQEALAQAVTHNQTTGLPRLALIEEYLQAACVEAATRDARVIVVYVDLDRFHATNETRGRAVGDHVLRTIAARLSAAVGGDGSVAQVAGDEFAVVFKDLARAEDQVEFGELIRARVEEQIQYEEWRIYVTCSVGVSCFPDNGSAAQDLLRQAESAMLRAKADGRNTVVAFASEYQQELDDRLTLGLRLNDALRNGEFLMHYQPRINGQDWRIGGFEALLRWQSPDLGLLAPGRFLRVAEDLGLMLDIGSFALHSACRQARAWIDAGAEDFSISVNVSPAQMQRPGFVAEVRRTLAEFKLPPRCIELELTESMMTGNIERVSGTMRSLKALGVKLSLDDFGTGYSSLNYLRRFPIDTLKIDQSFVQDISTDPGAAGVCRAIITLGHQLGMTVLAEGVQTAAQVGYLRRNECDFFQGYYFCKPVSAAQALEILRHRYLAHEGIEQPPEQQPTLLLVDDEENILNALVRMLRRDGYRILTATGAEAALDILGRNDVQVVISDQRMPGISGTELLSKVKDMYPETVRMVLSGYTDLAAVTSAINQGAIYKFLTKPWDDEDLRLQVRDAFRIAQRQGEARKSPVS
jgi:diguanylate cyclase (GGDEF)-like protein/PAS domain S-box-containing protein